MGPEIEVEHLCEVVGIHVNVWQKETSLPQMLLDSESEEKNEGKHCNV